MNVAAVAPSASSFLTVFPAGIDVPLAANLNWVAGQPPVSNAVTADLGPDGRLSFYNLAGTVHVTADVNGYYVDHGHDDRYAATGHLHDDRYVKRIRTLQLDGTALEPLGSATDVGFVNGCVGIISGTRSGWVPIPVEAGSTITAARAYIWDDTIAQGYTVELLRRTRTATGTTLFPLATASGGAQSVAVVTHALVPAQPEVVDVGETIVVSLQSVSPSVNALCQLEVDVVAP